MKGKKKTSIDISQETWETLQSLKIAYGLKASGDVIDMTVSIFYKAYLEKLSKL